MKKNYFITGTDTDCGKTYVTTALLKYYNQNALKSAALKPIASGCQRTQAGWRNDDAEKLLAVMSMRFTYEQVNPFAFEQPVSPHLAAPANSLNIPTILAACQPVLTSDYDRLLIEGAGGWCAPINHQETMADLAQALHCPIILVVGLRLGCLNHALLTWENIQSRQLPFAGWIANQIDPKLQKYQENIDTLERMMGLAPISIVPYGGSVTSMLD
jgi:dethiobiotin synthetase